MNDSSNERLPKGFTVSTQILEHWWYFPVLNCFWEALSYFLSDAKVRYVTRISWCLVLRQFSLTLPNTLPSSLLQFIVRLLPGSDKAPHPLFDVSYRRSGVDMMVHTHKQTHVLWCNDFLTPVVSCQQTCWNLLGNPRCGKYPCKSESVTQGTEAKEAFTIYLSHTITHTCTHNIV